jgi:acetyl-CoA carboxylase biotin carboxyl carrier protein
MELDEIKTIVELMAKHNLSEFNVEADNMHLCLKRDIAGPVQQVVAQPQFSMPAPAVMPTASAPIADAPKETTVSADKITINSPIVGTFYRASSPDAEPFVKIGAKVETDTVVCVIEAMKVLNEIKAEKSGVIKEILVENAQSVEYGCPLFVFE